MALHDVDEVRWALQQAHRNQDRWDHRHTPGDYWRSWSWLERAVMLAVALVAVLGGWVILGLAIVAGGS